MLALISIVTGVAAGALYLVQAQRQPEKAKQLRGLAMLFFGIAAVMTVVFVL